MIKKFKHRLIAVGLAAGLLPTVPLYAYTGVSFVEIQGIQEAFQTLEGTYQYDGSGSPVYEWQVSDTYIDGYSPTGKTEKDFYVDQNYEDKWLKFIVRDETAVYESEPKKIGSAWGKKSNIDNVTLKFDTVLESTPSKYIFTVGGEDYVLLDVTGNDRSKFLVIKDKTVGLSAFSTSKTNLFNQMAAFLNNTSGVRTFISGSWSTASTTDYTSTGYIGNAAYIQLDDVILRNINYEHNWKLEERYYTRPEGERGIQAGIVLPAVTEMERYCDRLGMYDSSGFWYRTPNATSTGGAFSASNLRSNIGKATETDYNREMGLRPMFYLDRNFFIEAGLPLSSLGSEVISGMKSAYTKEELGSVYSQSELTDVFGYRDNYSLDSVTLSDDMGNRIYSLESADTLQAQIALTSGAGHVKGAVYAAVYSTDGHLKAIGKKDVQIKKYTQYNVTVTVKNPQPEKDDSLRFFFWEEELAPFANSYEHDTDFGVRLSGIYETKQTLYAVVSGNPHFDYSYQWYSAEEETGNYTPIANAVSATFEVDSIYSLKWIKVRITLESGGFAEAEPRQIGKRWDRTSSTSVSGRNELDRENAFSVNGQKFVLLDTFESDKNKYLVICEEPVTSRLYNPNGGQQPNDMMAWLNGEEFRNGGYLPQSIHRHTDSGAVWKLEPYAYYNNNGTNIVENTTVGGLSLPSVSEVKKYKDKLTIYKAGGWWTRTPLASANGGDGNCVLGSSATSTHDGTFYPYYTKSETMGIRPIFYLDRSFFTQEKIDMENIGTNIRYILLNEYAQNEFTAYSEAEREILLNSGFVTAKLERVMDSNSGMISIPFYANSSSDNTYTFTLTADGQVVSEESFAPNRQSGETMIEIKGLYETNIPLYVQHDLGSGTQLQWVVLDAQSGQYTAINGATQNSFIPPQSMGQKVIKVIASKGGETFESEPILLNDRWYGKNQGAPNGTAVQNAEGTAMISSAVFGDTYDKTPQENIFTVGGQEFILLDTTEDDASRFLVMSKLAIGERTITTNGQIPADIMCWLNNKADISMTVNQATQSVAGAADYTDTGYLTTPAGFTVLPQAIIRDINYDAYWKQEPKMWGGDYERVYRAGITIPAVTEMERYAAKIGWQDSGTSYTWMRTGHANKGDGEQMLSYHNGWNRGTFYPNFAYNKSGGKSFGIRPIFYLKRDFFLHHVVTLSSLSAEIRGAIIRTYTAGELLQAGYNPEEVSLYYDMSGGLEGDTYYLSANHLKNGIYDMTLTVKLNGQVISSDSQTVCYMPLYQKQFMDFYSTKGYCDSLNFSWAYDYAMKSGVKMMRIGSEWHGIEPQKGVYNLETLDRRIEAFTQDGVELVFLMAYGNVLYSASNKTGPARKEAIDAFAKCLAVIAERYPQIQYFEVYNEPNLNGFWQPSENHRDYTYLLQVCDREVRKVRPDAKVAGAVVADGGATWVGNMLSRNAYPYLDVLSFHPYIYWNKNRVDSIYQSKLNGFTNKTLLYGGFKENIISEIGWPSYDVTLAHGCTEETQALETTKQFIFAEANGINRVMAYNFVNSGYNPAEPEHNFGVVTRDGNTKLAYLANAVMRNMLAGAVYCGELTFTEQGISHGYLYYKNGKPVLALWQHFPQNAVAQNINGKVTFSGESPLVYDMAGNLIQSGAEMVTLGSDIVYVTGLSDKWFAPAVAASYEKTLNARLSALGISSTASLYFASVLSEIKGLATVQSEAEAKALFDRHFAIADTIVANYKSGSLQLTEVQLSSLLDVVYETGVFVADYYMVAADKNQGAAVTAESAVAAVRAEILAKEDSAPGGTLSYANAIIEIAGNHMQDAKRVAALSEENPQKGGFIKSRDALTGELAKMASAICKIETLTYNDFVLFAPSEEVNLTASTPGMAVFSLYNYDNQDLNNAVIRVTDKNGDTLATQNVSVAAGKSKQITMNMTISSASVLSGGYGTAILTADGKTLQSVSVKLLA